ncbi:MAG: DUF1674 domain-containing protein [Gammaproteobacteria bacterium]|nr:DUF1674 domain-containing protein [Gammaproteobacteria bacterium]NIM73881.1 DUF1674 domain-containing protein [Gammaproteobacteria bacterium]NIN38069.1 DUF1674 domain-containing protein [Gammaproteobacteria bacterium]NIO25662.1 DUF1674 domain-containing protein [Gammaproteobacteria bacterium]NIO66296.1 DUF1674 domain-containing protein [Gammaproteobacteria bacterium]
MSDSNRRVQKPDDAGSRPAPAAGEAEPRPKAGRRAPPKEIGGPEGPEPTRYGDWERNGRCSDF